MNKILITLLILIAGTSFFTDGTARQGASKKLRLKKPDIVDLIFVNYNNWSYVMRNNGSFMYDSPDADGNHNNAGGEFPRGSGITIVYAGGLYLGTFKNGIPVVSETEFSTEFQPGRIINSGVGFDSLRAEDPSWDSQKVYLIDRSLTGDDFRNWPSDAMRDRSGYPAIISDNQTWAVFNDLNTSLNQESAAESPNPGLGLQVVLESFVVNLPQVNDAVYLKWTIENHSRTNYGNFYIGIWMDGDVNNASNDIVGVDTARYLGFTYNNSSDGSSDHLERAVGVDLLQGPVVHMSDIPTKDSMKFLNNTTHLVYDDIRNAYRRHNLSDKYITLGLTAFSTYGGGTDPIDNEERLNMLRGADKSSGTMKYGCGYNDYYAFRGNPITEQGTCDVAGRNNPMGGLYATAADQRQLLGIGPFTFRAGESQEIWAVVIGSLGTDRLDAVRNLFTTDDAVQHIFDQGSLFPQYTPVMPQTSASSLNRKAVITWNNNAEVTEDPTGDMLGISVANGYTSDYLNNDFQGYRVYRSLTGLEGSFELLAQFDKVDEFGYVTDRRVNIRGALEMTEIHIGDNTGLRYSYTDTDVINGQNYFYSVTAFDAQPYIGGPDSMLIDGQYIRRPAGIPITQESPLMANVVSVVPSGIVTNKHSDVSITSSLHAEGTSDGYVALEIVDPSKVISADYRIEFFEIPADSEGAPLHGSEFLPDDRIVYRFLANDSIQIISSRSDDPRTFYDFNSNGIFDEGSDIVLDDSKFATHQADYYDWRSETACIVNGIHVVIYGPLPGFKAFNVTANAGGLLNPPAAGAATFQGFPSSDPDLVQDQQVNGSFWFVADWRSSTLTTGDYERFVINTVTDWHGWNNLIPFDFEYRFTDSGQMAFNISTTTLVHIPFEVWNVTIGTKLLVNILDDAGTGNFQLLTGSSADHPVSGGTNDPRTCRFYVNEPSDMSPGTSGYDEWLLYGPPLIGFPEYVIGRQVFVNWNGGDVVAGVYNQPLPEVGTVFRINTTKPNSASDVFTFSSTANSVVTSKKDLKRALKDIKVVPNPFYKYSSFETQFDKLIKFTHLPDECTIRIFTVAGDLVKTIRHNASSNNDRVNLSPYDDGFEPEASATSIEKWDLTTANGRYVASGMYIALIESKAGKHFVKFAIIQ